MHVSRKLCLIVVDSLRTDMLLRAVADDLAPNFAALLERGTLIGDCVSAFPSVTPVACSEIATGVGPDGHWISGMNWYHRAEQRYVEYGSSFEATRAFGLFRTLYDTVYNMNMAHLSHEVETVFERLGDAGVRTACTPFLIYRGRRRHELGLEGLLRRVAVAANFRHAVWGPDELFYGELYASRQGPVQADAGAARNARRLLGLRRPRAGRARTSTTSCSSRCPTTTTTPTRYGVDGDAGLDRPRRPLLRRDRRRGRRDRRLPRCARGDPDGRPRPDRRRARRCRWPRRWASDWRVLEPNAEQRS